MNKLLIGLNLVVFLLLPIQLHAGVPLETIQASVNKILETAADKTLQEQNAKEKRIESIVDDIFDFLELSKRTLGLNWKKLNPDQGKEFVDLYRAMLAKAYLDKILSYTNEKVVFSKEIKLSEDKTEVQSEIVTESRKIPIHYRMILKDGQWKVYDVTVEGVSLIQNYRSQFQEILTKKSPEEMLEILRKKVG